MFSFARILFAACLLSMTAGCSSSSGQSTGATCDSSLTYENFGQSFMSANCTRCHDREQPRLTTVETIRANRDQIDRQAGSGPSATNTAMPQDKDVSTSDRKKLSSWLACNAP
jgi:hypothetical protein